MRFIAGRFTSFSTKIGGLPNLFTPDTIMILYKISNPYNLFMTIGFKLD